MKSAGARYSLKEHLEPEFSLLYSSASAPITLPSDIVRRFKPQSAPRFGTSEVLATLMPRLMISAQSQIKPSQKLHQVDHYMLREAQRMCMLLQQYCAQANIAKDTELRINLCGNKLRLSGDTEQHQVLLALLNKDKWLKDTFSWLQPNLLALAHSVELLSFANLYQRCRQQALSTYQHFDQPDSGLRISLLCRDGNCSPVIESPVIRFHLE